MDSRFAPPQFDNKSHKLNSLTFCIAMLFFPYILLLYFQTFEILKQIYFFSIIDVSMESPCCFLVDLEPYTTREVSYVIGQKMQIEKSAEVIAISSLFLL